MENQKEIEGIEDVAGIVDDVTKEEEPATPAPEMVAMQTKIEELTTKIATNETTNKAEKDEVIERFSKAVGFIEGSGMGSYDPVSGAIIRKEPDIPAVDNVKVLQDEINTVEKEALKEYKDGDITQSEYYEKLQDTIQPMKDKLTDAKFDKLREDMVAKKEPEAPVAPETPDVSAKEQEYNKMVEEYPDITNTTSQLFKKMDTIYADNKGIYTNPNFNGGKGDPAQYRDLIQRATIALKAEGVDIKKAKATVRNQFSTPGSTGYVEPKKTNSVLDKDDVGRIVSQGITSKTLLNDINTAVGAWEETGQMVMDD